MSQQYKRKQQMLNESAKKTFNESAKNLIIGSTVYGAFGVPSSGKSQVCFY